MIKVGPKFFLAYNFIFQTKTLKSITLTKTIEPLNIKLVSEVQLTLLDISVMGAWDMMLDNIFRDRGQGLHNLHKGATGRIFGFKLKYFKNSSACPCLV